MEPSARGREVRALYERACTWVLEQANGGPRQGWFDGLRRRPPRAWATPSLDWDPGAILLAVDRLLDQRAGDSLDADLVVRSAESLWCGASGSWRTGHHRDWNDAEENLPVALAWARRQARRPPDEPENVVFKPVVGAVAVVMIAATAVTAYLVWRGRQEQRSTPSPQLKRVKNLLGTGGPAEEGARQLVADAETHEPSAWTIAAALGRLGPRAEEPPVRACLATLAALPQSPVHLVEPTPGAPFDPRTMRDVSGIHEGDRKRVSALEAAGFTVAGASVPARVRCETEDWIALSEGEGPVADWVRAHSGELISEVAELCARWRAADGLQEPALLAEALSADVQALATWRDGLATRLARVYAGRDDAPRVGPEPGDLYQPAWMRLAEGATAERSVVTEVVFAGLAAPGGYAIVEAVVRVRTAADQEGRA